MSMIIVPQPPRRGQLAGEPPGLWPPFLCAQGAGYQWAARQSQNIVFGGILLPMHGNGGLAANAHVVH
jgi:hypothetical protein